MKAKYRKLLRAKKLKQFTSNRIVGGLILASAVAVFGATAVAPASAATTPTTTTTPASSTSAPLQSGASDVSGDTQGAAEQNAIPTPTATPSPSQQPSNGPGPPQSSQPGSGQGQQPQPSQGAPESGSGESSGQASGGSDSYDPDAIGNCLPIAKYLVTQGFSKASAAGVAATVYGESLCSPDSVGSGGAGLIGWTPASTMAQYGAILGNLQSQEQGLINYANANGPVGELKSMTDPVAAGDLWSQAFERPAVIDSDTRPTLAQKLYSELGSGS